MNEQIKNDILHYGEYLSDKATEDETGFTRERIIKYDNKTYYHKMHNGEVIELYEMHNK